MSEQQMPVLNIDDWVQMKPVGQERGSAELHWTCEPVVGWTKPAAIRDKRIEYFWGQKAPEFAGHPKSRPQQRVKVPPTKLQPNPVGQPEGADNAHVLGNPVKGSKNVTWLLAHRVPSWMRSTAV